MAWGYTMRSWLEESPVNRAKCIAHVLHKNLRESYAAEVAMEKGREKGSSNAGGGSYEDLMRLMH